MSRDLSDIGRAARAKGIKAERDLAKYLRTWWPDAERTVITGWRSTDRESADLGDIRGTPGLAWQLKYITDMTDKAIVDILHEVEQQRRAAKADYGIVVQRRSGKSDPGRWWAWLHSDDYVELCTKNANLHYPGPVHPVRLQLGDLIRPLLNFGYGKYSLH